MASTSGSSAACSRNAWTLVAILWVRDGFSLLFVGGTAFALGMIARYGPSLLRRALLDDASAVTVSLRVDGSFSTRMFVNAFIQYNSVTHQVLSNIRYDFIHHPLSDVFVTYNDTRDIDGALQSSKQLVFKITHLLSF